MDLIENLQIETVESKYGYIEMTMPVTDKVKQPFGYLHGGATIALAETAASVGAHISSNEDEIPLGLEINANHIKSIRSGEVRAVGKALHIGRTTQVWDVKVTNEEEQLISVIRATIAIKKKR
ncbi:MULTISPECIES: PaaI family thioesterase [Mammaliicoccus]|uniref:PaaI family thioesterase n=1 Tax=Mammaliicoccus fleurettii TaxID=150056 RepID=A0ABS5MSD0_9STAP|nr:MULTISPECIES: PaaI family thioesterase [Mammaliicoccus]HCN61241.1 PaaI family thioesterase [Staphylococcus sp.]MBL0847777.1 PaaI family thioesterase [Mammaliicoccus fleurettii]MBS3671561.1 PaaI family thioesterase [Mammaliicoccus fleurettii]MBS3698137.1 PaaI family thioesterase [Mammaliicoccus fleurettii]MBW0763828.1 PaaI family thioesterase [Mammaliicoccus fleurettii]